MHSLFHPLISPALGWRWLQRLLREPNLPGRLGDVLCDESQNNANLGMFKLMPQNAMSFFNNCPPLPRLARKHGCARRPAIPTSSNSLIRCGPTSTMTEHLRTPPILQINAEHNIDQRIGSEHHGEWWEKETSTYYSIGFVWHVVFHPPCGCLLRKERAAWIAIARFRFLVGSGASFVFWVVLCAV